MFNAHIITIDSDVIFHNIAFARFDEKNHEFVFTGRTIEETVRLPQERVISIEFGEEPKNEP